MNKLVKQYKDVSFKIFIANIKNDYRYINKYNDKIQEIEQKLYLQGIKIK